MNNIKQFILKAAQPLEIHHSHILGHMQHINHQLFNIMIAPYHAQMVILVHNFGHSAIYSR
jgi:hypothetical protein